MVEKGKRSRQRDRDTRDGDTEDRSQKRRSYSEKNSDEGDLVVYRILCPGRLIGSVIGKGGKVIGSLRRETGAWIKVVDPFPGVEKRLITIYCYVKNKDSVDVDEDDYEPHCSAQEALLKVHETIVNLSSYDEDSDNDSTVEAEIIVPSSQASNIIGKSGTIIKKLRARTKANIKISSKDPSNIDHSMAMSFDNFVQITGKAEAVRKALCAVSAIMFKFSPKEDISLDTTVTTVSPKLPPSILFPSDIPIYPASSYYPSIDSIGRPHSSVPSVIGATTQHPEHNGFTSPSGGWPVYASPIPVSSGYSKSSRSEELVMRVLCPTDRVGYVIGKGGSSIKSIRQTSGASVEADDPKNKADDCVITVTSTESTEDAKSAAVEAILLLQEKINNEDDDIATIRLLVESKDIGCLIGKNGSVVSDMRKKTRAHIYISKGEKPRSVSYDDELVEVKGEPSNVRDALLQITLRLREHILRDRDDRKSDNASHSKSVYSSSLSVPQVLSSIPPVTQMFYDQRVETGTGFERLPGSSLYGYGSIQNLPSIPPVTQFVYDQRVETGSGSERLPGSSFYKYGSIQAGGASYGSLPSYTTQSYGGLPSFSEVAIPMNALSKVLGKGGANLVNIQKISGAEIDIVDSKTSQYEHIAKISGTSEQKRAAENLIQAFILST